MRTAEECYARCADELTEAARRLTETARYMRVALDRAEPISNRPLPLTGLASEHMAAAARWETRLLLLLELEASKELATR